MDNKQNRSFHLSKPVRLAIYVPLLGLLFFWGLRRFELAMTFHPEPYRPGPAWTPPANGEDVWIEVAAGERIHGWFLASPRQPSPAAVLYFHGNGGNLSYSAGIAQAIAHNVADTLIVDYRGYGRSDGEAEAEEGLYADGEAAYEYLVRRRGVAPEKIVLYGQSLGTAVAIDLAARKACGALIVESGFYSAGEMGKIALPWLPGFVHRLARNRFESGRKIGMARCPALVMHGTHDDVIPLDQGRMLFQSAREPKQWIEMPGGDHMLFTSSDDAFRKRIFQFIDDRMK